MTFSAWQRVLIMECIDIFSELVVIYNRKFLKSMRYGQLANTGPRPSFLLRFFLLVKQKTRLHCNCIFYKWCYQWILLLRDVTIFWLHGIWLPRYLQVSQITSLCSL